jgi:hypothetical protein
MFLEFDWCSSVFRPRVGRTFIDVRGERSWPTMQAAKDALTAAGLVLGKRTDSRSWAIDLASTRL